MSMTSSAVLAGRRSPSKGHGYGSAFTNGMTGLAHRVMLSSPGAPVSVRRGEQVAIMIASVTT